MRSKLSLGRTAVLIIFAAALFMTGTRLIAQEKILHSFDPTGGDGQLPNAGLIFDAAGNLYGAAGSGGTYSYYGAVFELSPAVGGGWTETVLHSFNSNDGNNPAGTLIFDAAGNLYGTTAQGGAHGGGEVFELSPASGGVWTASILHAFGNGHDASYPLAGLVFDSAGNLYGTTMAGGEYGLGTVFELSPAVGGGWTEKVLHSFGNGSDGQYPISAVIFDGAGNLYGTTNGGSGTTFYGSVFELSPSAGGPWQEKILHAFKNNGKDGMEPVGSLIFDAAGNLYGTAEVGGSCENCFEAAGAVFELTPKAGGGWSEKLLHSFNPNGVDGQTPNAGLIFDSAGNLYSTTSAGGAHGTSGYGGIVFELKPAAGGGYTEKILHNFGAGTDGSVPGWSSLIFDAAGNLYGTTEVGGSNDAGTVYEITP
jgi:uncharacterized repeat protein (TIGR03803 family)